MEKSEGHDHSEIAEAGFEGFLRGAYDKWLSFHLVRGAMIARLERKPVIMPDTLAAASDTLDAMGKDQEIVFGALVVAVADKLIDDAGRSVPLRSEPLRILKGATGGDYGKFLKGVEAKLVADLRALGVDVEGLIAQQPETVREITGIKVLDALLGLLPCVKAAEKLKNREALVPKLAERRAAEVGLS